MRSNYTKAMILCRCGFRWNLCVPVGLAVPAPLKCSPGTPIATPVNSRSDICCPRCRAALFSTESELRNSIEGELRRRLGQHAHVGTVMVDIR